MCYNILMNMHSIKQIWFYIRMAIRLVALFWPIALAVWAFHLALGLHTGPMDYWMGFLGFAATLVLFRGFWRQWIAFFGQIAPILWRFAVNLSADLSYRVRTDWADLRRVFR